MRLSFWLWTWLGLWFRFRFGLWLWQGLRLRLGFRFGLWLRLRQLGGSTSMLAREAAAMAKPDAGSRRFVDEEGGGSGRHGSQKHGEEKAA